MSDLMLEELRSALEAAGCRWGVSEAHGTLAGLVCAEPQEPVGRWVREIELASEAPSSDALEYLSALGYRGIDPIHADSFDFQPLLPDDDAPMAERTSALAQWCQGFLYGFALAGQNPAEDATGDVPEVMADIAEITRAEFSEDQPPEEAEAAYTELLEFVRVAVQLVFYELAISRCPNPGSEET